MDIQTETDISEISRALENENSENNSDYNSVAQLQLKSGNYSYGNHGLRVKKYGFTIDKPETVDVPTVHCENGSVCDPSKTTSELLKQIEFYFSNANILKDQFLLNHVKSSKEGYVKISVIEKFKRIRQLTEDHDMILHAISLSEKLELSDDKLNVRRREPLPKWDSTVYYRTVLISDFPEKEVSLNDVTQATSFEGHSPLLVRILPPTKKVPFDLRKSQEQHPCIGAKLCAVVELSEESMVPKAISAARERWPDAYIHPLSGSRRKNAVNNSKKLTKKKQGESNGAPDSRPPQPLFTLKSPPNGPKVVHLREPIGPPTEDSLGFPRGWREIMRLQRMCLGSSATTPPRPVAATSVSAVGSGADPVSLMIPMDSAIVSVTTSPGTVPFLSAG